MVTSIIMAIINYTSAMALQGLPGEETPPWISQRDGERCCFLCYKVATEGHLRSGKHLRKLDWWKDDQASGAPTWKAPDGIAPGAPASLPPGARRAPYFTT